MGDHLWLFSLLVSIIAISETGRAIASKIRYSSIIELAVPLIYIKVDKINTVQSWNMPVNVNKMDVITPFPGTFSTTMEKAYASAFNGIVLFTTV